MTRLLKDRIRTCRYSFWQDREQWFQKKVKECYFQMKKGYSGQDMAIDMKWERFLKGRTLE